MSLPVIGDTPAAMFAYVTALMDAGFVVAPPGLEAGEEKELINGILRGAIEHDGEETPTLLLYAANEGMEWSVLRVYLDTPDDVKAFEAACGVKLDAIPVYEGKDKPKRDGSKTAQKYIFRTAKPVPVIFKQNPKYDEAEAAAALAANKPYTKAKRIFLRWDGVAPAADQPPAGPAPLTNFEVAVSMWKMRLENVQVLDDINKMIPLVKAIENKEIRSRAWTMCLEKAAANKWGVDPVSKIFRHLAEIGATPPPTQPAPTAQPVTPAPVAAPPPPDEPPPPPPDDVHPLIAEWQKRLDPVTVNLAKLNGEVLSEFRKIVKSNPLRGDVWIMLVDFATRNGCKFDQATMKFIEVPPS